MSGHYGVIVSSWLSLLRELGEETFLVPYVDIKQHQVLVFYLDYVFITLFRVRKLRTQEIERMMVVFIINIMYCSVHVRDFAMVICPNIWTN